LEKSYILFYHHMMKPPTQAHGEIRYNLWTFEACLPLGPSVTSKLTFHPSFKDLKPSIFMAEKCTNKSSPLSSGVMKPNPLVSLNHFTVPVAIKKFLKNKKPEIQPIKTTAS
jgi:hypothetical protein